MKLWLSKPRHLRFRFRTPPERMTSTIISTMHISKQQILLLKAGRIVEKAYKGKVIRVVNTLANEQGQFDEIALKIRRSAQLPIEVVRGDLPKDDASPMTYARKLAKADGNVGSNVLIIDDVSFCRLLLRRESDHGGVPRAAHSTALIETWPCREANGRCRPFL